MDAEIVPFPRRRGRCDFCHKLMSLARASQNDGLPVYCSDECGRAGQWDKVLVQQGGDVG